VHLQILLEVEVGNLGLVVHAEELRERGIGKDAALEVGVKAVVGLDILRDELGHLRLRALGTRSDAHEGAELRGERLLLEEGVVRTTSLPGSLLLRGQSRGIDTALLLGVAGLLLGGLGSLLSGTDGITHLRRELRGESLELLRERRKESIRGLSGNNRGCSNDDRNCDSGNNNLRLRRGLLLGLGLCFLRRSRCGGGGRGFSGLLGLLISGHLVCLRNRSRG
jgi:hypothetical protein